MSELETQVLVVPVASVSSPARVLSGTSRQAHGSGMYGTSSRYLFCWIPSQMTGHSHRVGWRCLMMDGRREDSKVPEVLPEA